MGNVSSLLYRLQSNLPFLKARVGEDKLFTALQLAAISGKEDLFKELISAGALVTLVPVNDPEDITHNEKIRQMVQKFASKGDALCSKIRYFLDVEIAVQGKSPEEVFKTFDGAMLREHPQTHLTMTETLFSVTGPNADEYCLGSIKWLRDTGNVNAYVAGVVGRFPNIPETFVASAVLSLRAVLCTMEDIVNEQALATIDKLLDLLSGKERPDIWEAVLPTLYVITQKTKGMNGWDLNFVEKLCKTVVPFVKDQHPFDFRVYTYGIFANLLAVEHAASIIASVGVTSVPEDILICADMKMNDKLKELLRRLKNHFISQNLEREDRTALPESKKKKKKKKKEEEEEVSKATEQLSIPIMESASNVRPFNLNQTVSLMKCEWLPISKRWRHDFKKLLSSQESEVTRIGSMIYINKAEFCIAKGSKGTKVYLGLRNDATELAIKIAPNSNSNVLKNEMGILRLAQLYDALIVRYIGYYEDEKFSYLCLQLCEYTLEEYIKIMDGDRKELVFQILDGLKALHHQNPPILYGNLKPRNILIDVNGKARLADFGRSRRLPIGSVETKCSMSKETDIKDAGMLIYYIYTGGHRPFGDVPRDNSREGKYNLDHVKDAMAKDLVVKMIEAEPQKRPKVKECMNHPFFWSTERRVNYLKEAGNRKEVKRRGKVNSKLISAMKKCIGRSFTQWKEKFPSELVKTLEDFRAIVLKDPTPYPDNMLGLLHFIRNVYQHYPKDAAKVDLVSMFPRLFECTYFLAKSQGWNSEPLLKQMLITSDDSTADDAVTATNSDEHFEQPLQESQPETHHHCTY